MPPILLDLEKLSSPFCFLTLFEKKAPTEIEIGVGKGKFLIELAKTYPDRNFLGIEKSKKWIQIALERVRKENLTNIRLIQCYIEGFLERYISDETISKYHILFPDPWPKNRHQNRRLLTPLFIHQLLRTLRPQGQIYIATDYADYFQQIGENLKQFSSHGLRVENNASVPFMSNFQVKYQKEGRVLYFLKGHKDIQGNETFPTPPLHYMMKSL